MIPAGRRGRSSPRRRPNPNQLARTLCECKRSIHCISTLSVYNVSESSKELATRQSLRVAKGRMEKIENLEMGYFPDKLRSNLWTYCIGVRCRKLICDRENAHEVP